jgi:CheY-like chemotaxis protein
VPRKLLLADDSVTIQKVIELTFADEDIEVIAVSNGSQAISLAPVERPDIVLADVGMPERDGYEVAAFIKRTPGLTHIPVLLLTGAFEPIDEGRAQAAGCDGVLVKPFEPQMVINRVKDLIAGKRPLASGAVPNPAADPPPSPQQPPVPADEYFDRLNAAFKSRDGGTTAAPLRATAADLASELANWQPEPPPPASPAAPPASPAEPAASGPSNPAPLTGAPPLSAAADTAAVPGVPPRAASVAPGSLPSLAQAFATLLAVEQGTLAPPEPINEQALRDDVVEQVTQRVVERMTDRAVRDIVLDVAERLVREEIARIKGNAR